MLDTLVTGSKLTSIANAIRTAGGTSNTMTLDDMPTAIGNISGGGSASGFDWSKIQQVKFSTTIGSTAATSLDCSDLATAPLVNARDMFTGNNNLRTIDVSKLNTSSVTSMQSMFAGCSGLTALDVSNFDTSLVNDMSNMFAGCSGLTSLDVSNFNTARVTNMSAMFQGCSGLSSLDVSNFNTANVTGFSSMFYQFNGTSLDLSSFDFSRATTCGSMFNYSDIKSVYIPKMNTAGLTYSYSISNIFANNSSLEAIIWATDMSTVQNIPSNPTSGLGINSTAIVYVPDALVADYQAATNWSVIASRIKGVSELPSEYKTLYGIS